MGIAQCDARAFGTRLGYLATFAVILFCREIPWAEWLRAG
jgi:hypothetical protein